MKIKRKLLVGAHPQSTLNSVGFGETAHAAHFAGDFGLTAGFLQRTHAVGSDHVQNGEGHLILGLFGFVGAATAAVMDQRESNVLSQSMSFVKRVLPRVDGDDVGDNGSQEQADGQEGGQSVDETAQFVITASQRK